MALRDRASLPNAPIGLDRRRPTVRDDFAVCEFCAIGGGWLFKVDHPERN